MGAVENTRKVKAWYIATLLLALLLIGFGAFRVAMQMRLRDRMAAIRAAGEPVTFTELDAWYKTPAMGANAADYVTRALASLRIPEGEDREPIPLLGTAQLPPRTQPLDPNTRTLIDGLLADNRGALDLLYQSAAIEQSRYPVDLKRGLSTLLPHISEMSKAARLLALEAAVHADRGEAEPAARAAAAAYALGRTLLQEPTMVSQTTRYACNAVAANALEWALNRIVLTESSLVELDGILHTAHDPNALANALMGERCLGDQAFRDPRSFGFGGTPDSRQPSLLSIEVRRAMGTLDREWAVFLDLMWDYIEAGRLPNDLSDLVPAYLDGVPEDPFDGRPLRYKTLHAGYLLYSIGRDETDNGGKERPPERRNREQTQYDITLMVERP